MRKVIFLFALALGWTAAAIASDSELPKSHPDSSGWADLFKPDLSDARFPEGVWSMTDGVLTATEDQGIWTKKQYGNATVDLEFKNAEATNSGVFVYSSDVKNWIPNTVEVQICDDFAPQWKKMPATWHCAAFFGHKAPTKSVVKKAGEWNRMTITCRGPKITVVLNGEQVNEIDMTKWTSAKKNPDGSDIPPWCPKPWAELPTKGFIGLQGKHAGAPIYFRNMKIKPLDESASEK
jgi:hypothetical protein